MKPVATPSWDGNPGTPTGGTRRRRRGNAGTKVEGVALAAPYLVRNMPALDLLHDEALELIESKAEDILSEVGVEFRGNRTALRLWRDAGATVVGERVRFDRGMCRELIQKTATAQFTQHARNPERSVVIGGKNAVFAPVYGPPFVRSLDFERRYARLEDFEKLVKMTYLTPHLHHSGGVIVEPNDIPVSKRHLDMLYGHIKYSDKAFMAAVTSGERAQDSIEMARLVFGNEFVENNCVLLGLINVNSPLVADETMLAALEVLASHNQATLITPFIIAGASGMTSPAGMVAQAHAEATAVMALAQLMRPGCPVIYGYMAMGMNMKTGSGLRFDETWKSMLISGQLARSLGVPFRGGGNSSSSKIPDIQAGMEGTAYLDYSLLSGVNFLLHATGACETGLAVSMEKFVLDCELLGAMAKMFEPVNLSDEAFALEDIKEIGPGGNFLASKHTMNRFRTAFYEPEVFDGNSFEQWHAEGQQDAVLRANKVMHKRLAEYTAPHLDAAVDESVKAFIECRKSELPDSFA